MKRTTPWIVALACLTTIGGSLWAASEMNLAPWAAPAPAPVPKQLTVTGSPTDSIADAGATFTLNIQSDTAWTVTSGPDTWITFDNTTGPKGTTALTVTVAANTNPTPRTATIEVYATDSAALKQTIIIKQKGSAPATIAVTNVNLDKSHDTLVVGGSSETLIATILPAGATDQTVTWESSVPGVATVTPGLGLTATITPLTSGNTTIKVKTTDGGFEKSCNIFVKPLAVASRIFTVIPTTITHPATGGSGRDSLSITANVAWAATVQPGQSWLTIVGASNGTGNGRVILNYTNNTASTARSATVTLRTTTGTSDTTVLVTINQAAGDIFLDVEDTLGLSNVNFQGGNTPIKIKSNTLWRLTSDAPGWITFLNFQDNPVKQREGSNEATVFVRLLPNTTNQVRTGSITLETTRTDIPKITKTINVSQSITDFSFNIVGLSEPVNAAGDAYSLSLSGSALYAISTRNTDWLKILEGTVEKDSITYRGGPSTFKLLVKTNATSGPRIGSFRIYYAGELVQTRTITQTGNRINVEVISTGTIPAGGGTKQVRINGSTPWMLRISDDWLFIDKKQTSAGLLNDTLLTFRASGRNTDFYPRTATVTVATKKGKDMHTFTLTQDGAFSTLYNQEAFENTSDKGAERNITVYSDRAWRPILKEIPATPATTASLRTDVVGADTTLSWLTMHYKCEAGSSRFNGTIKIEVQPNKTPFSREALIIIKSTAGVPLDTITLRQYNAKGKITPRAAAVKMTSLTMNRPNVTINGEKNVQLSVAVKPDNATNKNVTWASSDTSIAKVDAKGLVTIGRKKGKVTITATAADGSGVKATSIIDVLIPQANMELSGLKVYATAGLLHLSLPASDDVQIYAVSGALVRSFTAPAGDTSVALPSGIYIVRVGSLTEKVAVE